ncbi:MAG: ZIP family metal transporter [Burkholderiales bacterium]
MSVLAWIITTSFAGGLLSVAAAAVFALRARTAHVPVLISYAVGALLGAVFLDILPHAFTMSGDPQQTAATILAGIMLFFILEKLVLWRHCHEEQCEAHEAQPAQHDHGRSGMMIMVGDTFHNFVDGILIAAAFLADVKVGVVTAIAIVAHEIPQEVGDFLVLLHSGYSKRAALLFNAASSLAMLVGGVIAYFALQTLQNSIPTLLALAAASMLYVAVADLIPGLHRRPEIQASLQQVALIAAGVATIWGVEALLH